MKPSSVVQSKIHDQLNYYISASKNDSFCSSQLILSVCWKRSKENSLSLYKIELNFTLNVLCLHVFQSIAFVISFRWIG